MKPEASIIVPVLRQDHAWLEQSVRSALAQTVRSQVVVVVSPHTPPGNREILDHVTRTAPDMVVVEQEPGTGFARAINVGIGTASADRIGLLLSDDWFEPTAVETCLPHRADVVCTNLSVYAADGVTRLADLTEPRTTARFDRLPTPEQKADFLSHFFLFARPALLAAGGADESLGDTPGVDDYDLVWVLLERGATVHIVETPLYNYRDHAGERLTTRTFAEMARNLDRILTKHGLAGEAKQRLLASHAEWFGRPAHVVMAEKRDAGARGQVP